MLVRILWLISIVQWLGVDMNKYLDCSLWGLKHLRNYSLPIVVGMDALELSWSVIISTICFLMIHRLSKGTLQLHFFESCLSRMYSAMLMSDSKVALISAIVGSPWIDFVIMSNNYRSRQITQGITIRVSSFRPIIPRGRHHLVPGRAQSTIRNKHMKLA